MVKREVYLKTIWNPYPAVSGKVFSPRDVGKEFQSISAGGAPKSMSFRLGARLLMLEKHPEPKPQSIVAEALVEQDGMVLKVFFENNSEALMLHNGFSIFDVLKPGDLLLIECDWRKTRVIPELFQRLEGVIAQKVKLLAPTKGEPLKTKFSVDGSRQWQLFLKLIRQVFERLDFVEVRTPTLVPSPGMEAHLESFSTEYRCRNQKKTFYLPTSPEFHLKKMLSMGWHRVFEFKECFRNEESGPLHQPEFLMLEWYRAFADLDSIIRDFKGILNYFKLHWPNGERLFQKVEETTVSELFKKYCEFELTTKTSKEELILLADRLEIHLAEDAKTADWDDVFFQIFLQKIEPHLGMADPIIIRNYPPSQAALARHREDGWVDRFELYWRGLEVANAFHELNDPVEQRRRFEEEKNTKASLGKELVPADEEFLQGLDWGMPPSGGIAVGLDRLFMAITKTSEIAQTRAFVID
jgi:lysyl-tRNA synthetase class 2